MTVDPVDGFERMIDKRPMGRQQARDVALDDRGAQTLEAFQVRRQVPSGQQMSVELCLNSISPVMTDASEA